MSSVSAGEFSLPDGLLSDPEYSTEKKQIVGKEAKESAGPTTATDHSSDGEIIIEDDNELMADVLESCKVRGELDALIEEDPELYDDLLAACSSISKKYSSTKSINESEIQMLAESS